MMIIENKFSLGDIVQIISGESDEQQMITGILALPNDQVIYRCVSGNVESWHYDIELQLIVGNNKNEDLPYDGRKNNNDSEEENLI